MAWIMGLLVLILAWQIVMVGKLTETNRYLRYICQNIDNQNKKQEIMLKHTFRKGITK